MHFVCSRSDLNGAIGAVQHAIGKIDNTIRDCILFEVRHDRVILKATDKVLSIRTEVGASVYEEGVAAVPARMLADIVKRLPEADVTISTSGDSTLYLQCLAAKVDLRLQNAAEFPAFPEMPQSPPVSLPQALLKEMIDQVIFCVATSNDAKPILTGVLFDLEADRLTLAALDGFRLAVREETILSDLEGSYLVPARALREAVRAMMDTEEETHLLFDDQRIRFAIGPTEITAQLLEGPFIPYRNLFPKSNSIQAQVDRMTLLETMQRACIMAAGEENTVVKLEISDNALNVSSKSQYGQISEVVPAITQGDDLMIALNGHYLIDTLKAIVDEEVTLLFNTSTSPCVLERHGIQAYGYLILPVQVRN